MLTINADSHVLMSQLHKPADEKRMVVILPDDSYSGWLNSDTNQCRDYLNAFPAEQMNYSSK